MKSGTAFTISLLLYFTACSRESPEVSYIGKIRHTEVISKPIFDLDAYHAPVVKEEFCTPDNQNCVAGRSFRIDIYEGGHVGRLLVTSVKDVNNKSTTGTYLFDTINGTPIICENCGWEKAKFHAGAWLQQGRVLVSSDGRESRLRVIEIDGISATQRFLDLKKIGEEGSRWFLSPSTKALAVFECTKQNCWLYWLAGDLKKVNLLPVKCVKDPEYLTVYWQGDVPRIAQTAWAKGAGSRNRCRNDDGSPMFPILNRDVYVDGRSATAVDILVGE